MFVFVETGPVLAVESQDHFDISRTDLCLRVAAECLKKLRSSLPSPPRISKKRKIQPVSATMPTTTPLPARANIGGLQVNPGVNVDQLTSMRDLLQEANPIATGLFNRFLFLHSFGIMWYLSDLVGRFPTCLVFGCLVNETNIVKNYRRRIAQTSLVAVMAGNRLDGWSEALVNVAVGKATSGQYSKVMSQASGCSLIQWYQKQRLRTVRTSLGTSTDPSAGWFLLSVFVGCHGLCLCLDSPCTSGS